MTEGSELAPEPIGAQLVTTGFTEPAAMISQAASRAFLEGDQPHVRMSPLPDTTDLEAVVPDGWSIDRTYADDDTIAITARRDQATLHLQGNLEHAVAWVSAASAAEAEAAVDEIRSLARPDDDRVPIDVHWRGPAHPTLRDLPRWAEVAEDFPPAVRTKLDRLMTMGPDRPRGRLVVWHGAPGTGKTTAAGALMREWSAWADVKLLATPAWLFGEETFLASVLRSGRRPGARAPRPQLVVVENVDGVLESVPHAGIDEAWSRILNITDGWLGSELDAVFLLTASQELTSVAPALTRPGRCLAQVRFERFSPSEAAAFLGRSSPNREPMTLAELLALRGDLTDGGQTDEPSTGAYL